MRKNVFYSVYYMLIVAIISVLVALASSCPYLILPSVLPNWLFPVVMGLMLFIFIINKDIFAKPLVSPPTVPFIETPEAEPTTTPGIMFQPEIRESVFPMPGNKDSLIGWLINIRDWMVETNPENNQMEKLNDYILTTIRLNRADSWLNEMHGRVAVKWTNTFQGATRPTNPKDYPDMNSLVFTTALHTIDFIRQYYGSTVFLQEMGLNPELILQKRNMNGVDGLSYSDDPFQVPREVRVLVELMQSLKIKELDAYVHGYVYPQIKPDITIPEI